MSVAIGLSQLSLFCYASRIDSVDQAFVFVVCGLAGAQMSMFFRPRVK